MASTNERPRKKPVTRDDAINLLLASIAFEELGLSHILNAEGEKLQHALGTLHGSARGAAGSGKDGPSIEELLRLNESVIQTLSAATQKELALQAKLETILGAGSPESPGLPGPPGPPGPSGPPGPLSTSNRVDLGFTGSFDTPNAPIPLTQQFTINGSDIAHTPGSAVVELAPGHTYQIVYTIEGTPLIGNGLRGYLSLNNVPYPGAEAVNSGTTNPLVEVAVGVALLATSGTKPSPLQVINVTGAPIVRVRMLIVELD